MDHTDPVLFRAGESRRETYDMVHPKLTPLAFFPLPLPLVSPTAYEEPRYAFLNPHVR